MEIIEELDEWLKAKGYRIIEHHRGRYGKKYSVKFVYSPKLHEVVD